MADRRATTPSRRWYTRVLGAVASVALLAAGLILVASAPATAAPPAPTATTSVIAVRVGSDRIPSTGVTPLPQATLILLDLNHNPINTSWSTCVSDPDGYCSFTVPDTALGGANYHRQFYVAQPANSAPPNYFQSNGLALGPLSPTAGNPIAVQQYQFRTPQVSGGQTYTSGNQFMNASPQVVDPTASQFAGSGGVWQYSRDNPEPTGICGLTVALVLDVSASVTAQQFPQLKAAAQTLVSALRGTPSSVAVFTFGTNASENITLSPVASDEQAAAVNTQIGALTQPSGQFTNWDAAFQRVTAAGDQLPAGHFDEAIMITDGNPTVYGTTSVSTTNASTTFLTVENGIFSANQLKAAETRIIALGVGAGVAGPSNNLAAVSGPTKGLDYFQETDYADAAAQLKALAQGDCIPSLSVIKEVVPPGGTTADAQPVGGWTFSVDSTNSTVSNSPGTTADGTGSVNFPLGFVNATDETDVTVSETLQGGFTPFVPDATHCRDIATDADVPFTRIDDVSFTLTMNGSQGVSCVVFNQAPDPLSTLRVDKDWVVNGETFANGDQPDGLSAGLTLDDQGASFGTTYGGYQNTPDVTVGETTNIAAPFCRLTGTTFEFNGEPAELGTVTLVEGDNTGLITNTVTCSTQLSLIKTVEGGDADPALWTLTATGPSGALPGPTGQGSAAPVEVTPGALYALSESGGDPNYAQVDLRTPGLEVPGSTGSWFCVPVGPRAAPLLFSSGGQGINGGIQVPLGEHQVCFATNQTSTLTLIKTVDNTGGGTKTPADWTLSASPTTEIAGLEPDSVPGSQEGTTFNVRPGTPYDLAESGPGGYHQGSLECNTGTDGAFVPATSVTLPALVNAICRFHNVFDPPAPPPTAPPTAGALPPEIADTGSSTGGPIGLAIVLIAVGLGALTARSILRHRAGRAR